MSLTENITAAMKDAMRAKDEAALRGLRAIKAAILIEQTAEGAKKELDEATEIKLLQKLVKQRKDSLEIFVKQDRADLAAKEKEEIAVIEKFLPAQMSEDELREVLKKIIAEVGATGIQDLGKVMGVANKQLAGSADGKSISTITKQLLGA